MSPFIFTNAIASPKSIDIGTRVTNKINERAKSESTTGVAIKAAIITNCLNVKTPKKILSSNSLSKGT